MIRYLHRYIFPALLYTVNSFRFYRVCAQFVEENSVIYFKTLKNYYKKSISVAKNIQFKLYCINNVKIDVCLFVLKDFQAHTLVYTHRNIHT